MINKLATCKLNANEAHSMFHSEACLEDSTCMKKDPLNWLSLSHSEFAVDRYVRTNLRRIFSDSERAVTVCHALLAA